MTTEAIRARNEGEVRELIDEWTRVLCAHDVDQMMAHYGKDVVLFDVKPPFQIRGADDIRSMWEACLPYFPAEFRIEKRDIRIAAGEDMVVAHWLFRIAGPEQDAAPPPMWMRATVAYQRDGAGWQVLHEHISVPFDPMTSRAVLTPEA